MTKTVTVRLDEADAKRLKRIARKLDRSQNWLLGEAWRRHAAAIEDEEIVRRRMADGKPLLPHDEVMRMLGAKG